MKHFDLPVYKHKDQILSALENSQAIVVESPTGSGKTTQLPVILYEAGYAKDGIIGVTQPRRIAALSLCEFIARQMESESGKLVGYKMRFEDNTETSTKIKIMTDGILLQEMKLDPWLSRYNCLIVDEAHERSLNIDFILGLLKRVLEERKDFKLIVSSATINALVFSEYLGQCPIVKIDAQIFPVSVIYDPPIIKQEARTNKTYFPVRQEGTSLAYTDALLNKICEISERCINDSNNGNKSGDILIFLPGEKMIKDCITKLSQSGIGKQLHILPLYGRLGKEEQEKVFIPTPEGKTKVIVSTNIAETSVTINGISVVIDSGLSKLNHYNPKTFTSSLIESPISKASANQRRGRAGRTMEGSCYRLYSRKDFENRPLFTTEEIYRTDLSEVVLRMADLGISSFEEFDFISPPQRDGLIAAIETLMLLDALESDHSLSNTGKLMTEFPLSPRHSRIITEAILQYPDLITECIIAAAFLSTQSPYILPPGEESDARRAHHRFRDENGDFVSYLKLFHAYTVSSSKKEFCEKNYLDERSMAEILNVSIQLNSIVSDMKIPLLQGGKTEDYLSAIAKGLIQFVCIKEGKELYRTLTADKIHIHPGSVMFRTNPLIIVAGEIIKTSRMYAMSVSPISHAILNRVNPSLASGLKIYQASKKERPIPEKERNFTKQMKIGSEVFELESVKGKKQVIMPWEKLRNILDNINPDNVFVYKGLRGVITLQNQYTLLKGEKIRNILTLAKTLDIDGALDRNWFNKNILSSSINLDKILDLLPFLAQPAIWRAKEKTNKNREKKELGFISLFTDLSGNYQLKCTRTFNTSLNESLFSLESLIEELDNIDSEKKKLINKCYRRLSDYLA